MLIHLVNILPSLDFKINISSKMLRFMQYINVINDEMFKSIQFTYNSLIIQIQVVKIIVFPNFTAFFS